MVDRYSVNPFQQMDILVPVEFHEDVSRFSQGGALDQSPFPRMIDLWFLAVCVAARLYLKPADITKYETRKFIDGTIFASDPWRIQILMLLAISQSGDIHIASDPRRMINLIHGLAFAGLPKVIDMLKDGGGDAIWNLSESVEDLLRKKAA